MKCTICCHSERLRIELQHAAGSSLDSLAAKFGVSRDAVFRHWHRHVGAEAKARFLSGPGELATLAEKATAEGDSVLDYLRMVRTTRTRTEGHRRAGACLGGAATEFG